MTHGFFVIMGGFHYYKDGKPLYPLHPDDVLELVQRAGLVPPTLHELKDKGKADAFTKCVTIVQTLWFVTQCIARRMEHLPATSLEIMTLAYTVITLTMYATWWRKPLNVNCPVRIAESRRSKVYTRSALEPIFDYVMGSQDEAVTLRGLDRVPTFWAGNNNGPHVYTADAIALLVAMVFGAIHCIAWSYEFPSHAEQLIWRVSAVTIAVVPVAICLTFKIRGLHTTYTRREAIGIHSLFVCALIYIIGRSLLLVLSFTTLRSLPCGAYLTIWWVKYIPHI